MTKGAAGKETGDGGVIQTGYRKGGGEKHCEDEDGPGVAEFGTLDCRCSRDEAL